MMLVFYRLRVSSNDAVFHGGYLVHSPVDHTLEHGLRNILVYCYKLPQLKLNSIGITKSMTNHKAGASFCKVA